MIGKFEISKSAADTFMFKLRADNGLVILQSPWHATKAAALAGIEAVRIDVLNDRCFERLVSPLGQPSFILRSSSDQVIGHSQAYSSGSAMENGIASVVRNGPNAVIVDMAPQSPRRMATR